MEKKTLHKQFDEQSIFVVTCDAADTPPHDHAFLELMYVVSGEAVHTIEGEVCRLKKGDYYIIDYQTVHSYRAVGTAPFSVINCIFLPSFIDPSLTNCRSFGELCRHYLIRMSYAKQKISRSFYRFTDKTGEIGKLLAYLLSEFETKKPGYTEILRSQLITLLILSLRTLSFEEENDPITRACKYISSHYAEKITLSAIAKRMNYSTPYFCQKFCLDTGIHFSEYVERVRAAEACRLLANTRERVIDIAGKVGYKDTDAFLHMFHRQCGMSPREYRTRIKAKSL